MAAQVSLEKLVLVTVGGLARTAFTERLPVEDALHVHGTGERLLVLRRAAGLEHGRGGVRVVECEGKWCASNSAARGSGTGGLVSVLEGSFQRGLGPRDALLAGFLGGELSVP